MQFLKRESSLKYLQFCFAVGLLTFSKIIIQVNSIYDEFKFLNILIYFPIDYHLNNIINIQYQLLSFKLTDEFNEKLLNPDLKRDQLERLQLTGRKLFDIFFSGNSPDRIHFGAESKIQMKKIVYGNVEDIVLLRTCPTLFEAYDHVMDVLENKILIRFYRSSEVGLKNCHICPN